MAASATSLEYVQKMFIAYFGRPAAPTGQEYYGELVDDGNIAALQNDFWNSAESQALFGELTTEGQVDAIFNQLFGRSPELSGLTYWTTEINSGRVSLPNASLTILNSASGADLAVFEAKLEVANAFTAELDTTSEVRGYQANSVGGRETLSAIESQSAADAAVADITNIVADVVDGAPVEGSTFTLTEDTAASADVMRLGGDMDVRIDLTVNNNQVKGLDLDGDGVIEPNGVENNNPTTLDNGKDFEIVDAYVRDRLNLSNLNQNFLGDISFDVTGFDGDGVSTDGNIFLGGLGADLAFGGIGNDFMVGGGVIDTVRPSDINENGTIEVGEYATFRDDLHGGRNADFFFAEFSTLDVAEGDSLFVDGGSTSDDAAVGNNTAQDSDWFLVEASDDEEPYTIDLSDEQDQTVTSTAGHTGTTMWEIENIDASGNLYGFVDDVDVALGEGGRVVNGENVGIGSSAQLEIIGSVANNILIGGFDNDRISGAAGADLLMGGNLNYLNNPNLLEIVNNGMDEMAGGTGDDSIVFEADGGTIEGGLGIDVDNDGVVDFSNDAPIDTIGNDTLWLTREALGTQTVADLVSDSTLRFDLEADVLAESEGYGGADAEDLRVGGDGSQDQTKYIDNDNRVDITGMESVIATGLGAVDYLAAGTNDPELSFNNQQNHRGLGDVNLDLRGLNTDNTLYADAGDDVIEGRSGDDLLSGGEGNDDFVFWLQSGAGDGVDVIHRQTDANNDNIWDTDAEGNVLYGQDFGVDSTSAFGPSTLTVDFSQANLADANVSTSSFSVVIGSVTFAVTDLAALALATTTAELAALANTAFQAIDPNVTVTASGDIITITDSTPAGGRVISDTQAEGYAVAIAVVAPGTGTLVLPVYVAAGESVSEDRLVYVAYEDEDDGELVDDGSTTGSSISLGVDSYAEDLVIDFAAADYDVDGDGIVDVDSAGTRIAEDQSYTLTFDNLTTEDTVALGVNGVTYTLQVGVDLDGNEIANEELTAQGGSAADQAEIQTNFLLRLEGFINSFMDDDTAAGKVLADATATTLTLTQVAYNGEETVFMRLPTVVLTNGSGGQTATAEIVNNSEHEVQLLDFDGRDGNLNAANVVFVGNTDISRAILETAADTLAAGTTFNTLNGSEAVVIDGGSDTLAATVTTTGATIFNNTATNSFLRTDFAVHGDDFLIGGDVVDHISAGTGDDRVHGSLGADVIDGGKSFYKVQVLGEASARVYVLNQWEAEHTAEVAALNGLTITGVNHIGDVEDGNNTPDGTGTEEVFNDTLQFQQSDFVTGSTRFTVTLNDFVMDGTELQLKNGGAGTVGVDTDGNGSIESTTTFTNFENIRTISGTGNAVADDGQGNDTLDVSAISSILTGAGGVSYDLTSDVGGVSEAGEVRYSTDDILNNPVPVVGDKPIEADYDALVIKVDGVENVVGGTGDDLLLIDETEAAKDNSFAAGLGVDRIEYLNDYNTEATLDLNGSGGAPDATDDAIAEDRSEATITIAVTAVGSATVASTGGRVGSTVAIDTLTGVEYLSLEGNTAQNALEADVLDLTSYTGGATFDYATGNVSSGGVTQIIIDIGATEIENVWGDGNDTVLIADDMDNARDDSGVDATDAEAIEFSSFFDYDDLDADDARQAFGTVGDDVMEVINQNQYTFDLSRVGSDADSDIVDYKAETGNIVAVVSFDTDVDSQYIMVDTDGNGVAEGSFDQDAARIDRLIGVENVVAAQGQSVLDLTNADQDLRITFSADYNNVANYNAGYAAGNGLEIHQVAVTGATVGAPDLIDMNYLDYVFVDTTPLDPVGDADLMTSVYWNQIEGSDFNETVELSGWEAAEAHVLNLRGGQNQVNYEGDSVEITIDVSEFDELLPTTTGLVTVQALHTAPGDDHDALTVDADVSGTDTITSYSAQNTVSGVVNTLTIKGARGDLDTVAFAGGLTDSKFFILGGVTDATTSITVTIGEADAANSIELVGFESLQDAATDDVYDMADLEQVQNDLSFLDNVAGDRDTIKVGDDAIAYDGGPAALTAAADTISLEVLNDVFGFDFDVLDITSVTDNNLLIVADDDDQDGDATLNAADTNYIGVGDADSDGASDVARDLLQDDVVVGDLDLIDSVAGFDTIYFTNASITSAGTEFVLDVTGGELEDDTAALFTLDSSSMDFSRVTGSNLILSAISATAVEIVGGAGNDDITGDSGNDTLEGGAGNDTLDGGIATEVRHIQINPTGAAGADATAVTITLDGLVLTLNMDATIDDVDADAGDNLDMLPGLGSHDVGAALATLVEANFADINDGARFGGTFMTDASYDNGTGLLTFTFTSGADVAVTDTIVIAGAGLGAVTVVAEAVDTEGGNGGSDTFVFADSPADNGVDTIVGFQAGADTLDFVSADRDSNSHGLAANAAAQNMHGDGEVYVFADGADGTGAETITSYTNTADVAAFLAAAFDDESAFSLVDGTGWISAVINDLLTDTTYVYDVRVGDDDILDAGSVTLIGIVSVDAALTTGDVLI
jgi:hypothetical protein